MTLIDVIIGVISLIIGFAFGHSQSRPQVESARVDVQSSRAALSEANAHLSKIEANLERSRVEVGKAKQELAASEQRLAALIARLRPLTLSGLPLFTLKDVRRLTNNKYQFVGVFSDVRNLRQGDWYLQWIPGAEPLLSHLFYLDGYSASGTFESVIASAVPAIGVTYPIL